MIAVAEYRLLYGGRWKPVTICRMPPDMLALPRRPDHPRLVEESHRGHGGVLNSGINFAGCGRGLPHGQARGHDVVLCVLFQHPEPALHVLDLRLDSMRDCIPTSGHGVEVVLAATVGEGGRMMLG
jgi:hypothetical protein